jgi:hypothetical protein
VLAAVLVLNAASMARTLALSAEPPYWSVSSDNEYRNRASRTLNPNHPSIPVSKSFYDEKTGCLTKPDQNCAKEDQCGVVRLRVALLSNMLALSEDEGIG